MTRWAPLALGMALLLAGCGDDGEDASASAAEDGSTTGDAEPLPKPEGAIGSVTGMPAHPGPGSSRIEPIEPVAIGAAETPEPPALMLPPALPEPSLPEPPSPNAPPIGTAAATESTTIVVEPDDAGDTGD